MNPPDSDSSTDDSSLEVVEFRPSQTQWEEDRALGLTVEARVEREYLRNVAQTSTPFSSSYDVSRVTPNESLKTSRGRPGRGILDSDHESDIKHEPPPVSSWSKKRHLAPLRALALNPPKPPERSSGSPYSFARSGSQFLRSTTSLCKISISTSTPSVVGVESTATRRLFSSKGKERAQDAHDVEPLDSWEIVDSDQPESPMESPKSPKRLFFPRLVAVPSLHRVHGYDTPRSPTVHASLRTHDQLLPAQPTEYKPSQGEKSTPSFLHRHLHRATPSQPHLTSSTPTSSPPVSPISISPSTYSFVSTTRSKAPPTSLSSRKHQKSELSPTRSPFYGTGIHDLQTTPTSKHPSAQLQAPRSTSRGRITESPLTAMSDNTIKHRGQTVYRLLVPSTKASNTATQNYTAPSSPTLHRSPENHTTNMSPSWASMSSLAPDRVSSPLSVSHPVATRHHYTGRPLPRPPLLTIDTRRLSDVHRIESRPESLLIDFEGDVCNNDDGSATSPVAPFRVQHLPQDFSRHSNTGRLEHPPVADVQSHTNTRLLHSSDPFFTPPSTSPGLPTPLAADNATSFEPLTPQGPGDRDTRSNLNVNVSASMEKNHLHSCVPIRVDSPSRPHVHWAKKPTLGY